MILLLEREDSQIHVLARRCEYKNLKARPQLLLSTLPAKLKFLQKDIARHNMELVGPQKL